MQLLHVLSGLEILSFLGMQFIWLAQSVLLFLDGLLQPYRYSLLQFIILRKKNNYSRPILVIFSGWRLWVLRYTTQ